MAQLSLSTLQKPRDASQTHHVRELTLVISFFLSPCPGNSNAVRTRRSAWSICTCSTDPLCDSAARSAVFQTDSSR